MCSLLEIKKYREKFPYTIYKFLYTINSNFKYSQINFFLILLNKIITKYYFLNTIKY